MKEIVEYRVVTANNSLEFEKSMMNAISDGWQPYGSGYSFGGNNGKLCQPIVKYEEDSFGKELLDEIYPEEKKDQEFVTLEDQCGVDNVGL